MNFGLRLVSPASRNPNKLEPYKNIRSGPKEDENMKTLRNSSIITLGFIALALLVAAPAAMAGTISYTNTISPTATNFPGVTGTLNQFDPSLGTLTSVEITISGIGSTVLTATANENGNPTVFSEIDTTVGLLLTDPGDAAVHTLQTVTGGPAVDSFDTLTVYYGFPYNSGPESLNPGNNAAAQTLTSNLGSFYGLGNITFDLAGSASTTVSFSGGNATSGQTTSAGADIQITYDYNEGPVVPEPGTLSLFGTGLLGLAGMLRFKFMRSR
jgi:PEP-CTERM motif